MQFLPADNSLFSAANPDPKIDNALSLTAQALSFSAGSHNGFDSVLSSFMEEGRENYTGRPAGFAAQEAPSGTLGDKEIEDLKKALEKRRAHEESLNALNALMTSGQPMTVGRIFGALSGRSRTQPQLEGAEREQMRSLLGKMGFTKDEAEHMLSLCDEGQTNAAWKMLSGKLEGMDGVLDVDASDLGVLLKGLDVSEAARKHALSLLDGADKTLSLNREQMKSLLEQSGKELAAREAANIGTQREVRAAVEEMLQQARIRKQSEPVSDLRGSRRVEQSEDLMRDSVLKKTGVDQLKKTDGDELRKNTEEGHAVRLTERREREFADARDSSWQQSSGKEEFEQNGRSRAENILRMPGASAGSDKADEAARREMSRLLNRVDAAVDSAAARMGNAQAGPANFAPAQNLNNVARNFRQEIFSQVESGILQNAQNGARQLTLQLDPKNLGQLNVIISVKEGELKATIKAETQDAASALKEQLAELRAALEEQGLKVKELEVRTGLQDDMGSRRWEGAEGHNQMRDAEERERALRLHRLRRDTIDAGGARPAASGAARGPEISGGLHIVA